MSVKLTVKTDIRDGDRKETFELIAFGRYYQKENACYLQYDEVMEEELPPVKTTIKMSGEDGLILRSGAVKMRLPFKMNKRLRGSYTTPYGDFELITSTKRLHHQFNDETGEGAFEVLYDLKMQGAQSGTYHLTVNFKEEC
ncbi:DUF1934 domain-containing protein [Bacillus sp. Bva_UNVM-123]